MREKRLFLRLGDQVIHRDYGQWGYGVVIEEMTSSVPGGTCLVRVDFDDGRQRTFNNDLDSEMCCYYFGLRRFWAGDEEVLSGAARRRGAAPQRRLPRR